MRANISKYLIHYPFHFANGQKLSTYYNKFEKTQWLSLEMLNNIQWDQCKNILKYAYENVPYYKNKFDKSNVHPDDIKNREDYLKVPVLSKEDIKNNHDNLISNSCTLKGYKRKTSGSTGTPLLITKDGESLAVMDAVMFRNYNWYGVGIGDRQVKFWGSPLNRIGKIKTKVKDFMLNRTRFSAFDLSEKSCYEYYEHLIKFKPRYVHGYAQTIFNFSEYILSQGYDLSGLNLRTVILTGEMIYEDQKRSIERAFGSRVSNEYGCTEAGTIAMSCPANGMHLMMENLYTEFVSNGKHVLGEKEGEIIITELYGKIMPLIRYKIEDIGNPGNSVCDCGRGLPLLKNLKGRSVDFILCPDGKRVDPYVFSYILHDIPEKYGIVTKWRIIQEKDYNLDIDICYKGEYADIMLNLLETKMKKCVSINVKIIIRITADIPVEQSGKLRCFISRLSE